MAQRGVAPAEACRALEADLKQVVDGDVRFDPMSRVLYSTDASNYQIEPIGVVRPKDAADVSATVATCATHQVPVIARAGGSGLAGQAIGAGVVIDVSAHLTGFEIDPERRRAVASAGVVLDRLNDAAAAHGLEFGPDPASSDRACVGGVVGNNAAGAHSIVHGMTADHVLAAEVVLADGSLGRLAPMDWAATGGGRAGDRLLQRACAALQKIVTTNGDVIDRDFPTYWRRSGGYNLDRLLERHRREIFDPTCLLPGSEGTLAIATELELRLVERPHRKALLVAHFERPLDPFRAVPRLLETHPSAIELVDRRLLELARSAPGFAEDAAFVAGDPEALLVIEYAGPSDEAVRSGLDSAERVLAAEGLSVTCARAESPERQAQVWRVRKAGLGLLMRMRGDWKPVAGIEDAAVPPEHLADYIAEVRRLLDEMGVDGCFYAHASAGCIHVRPILNLKTADGVARLGTLADETARLAMGFGGVISSEHGDGLARSARNREQFGDEVYELFEQVKSAFDPERLLNPGKVVCAPDPSENLRLGPLYGVDVPSARFDYPDDGDFARAVEQCNGAGVCRKLDSGAMCPSYMITRDEEHSTRGRANALRAILDGRLPADEISGDRLAEVMRLCVGCKACKSECPSGVDMARLRTEVLAARHEAHGSPLVSRLLGNVHQLERRLAPVAPLANAALRGPLWPVGARLLGLDPRRRFPELERQTFDRWWRDRELQRARAVSSGDDVGRDPGATGGEPTRRGNGDSRPSTRLRRPAVGDQPTVVLFADTFATYQEPSVGRAAALLLEAAGYRVIVPERACCGRPALSQGLIDTAVRGMRRNVAVLAPLARHGLSIVVPEPSCASALSDDMPDLLSRFEERDDAHLVAAAVVTLDEFVAGLPPDALRLRQGPANALLHVHCHQRAHAGVSPSLAALSLVPGLTVHEPDAGCCGMAGAFGYRAETYDASIAMAERKLAPAVRFTSDETVVVAAGASCRQQIADTTGRRPVHPAELLASLLPG